MFVEKLAGAKRKTRKTLPRFSGQSRLLCREDREARDGKGFVKSHPVGMLLNGQPKTGAQNFKFLV